ncbi:MAG: HDOD domain-containing protein [Phycisphaeraceae bacterium]|nr:HDOD domain-containing protein [Phycisphaeraceae bacterium]
MDRPDPSSLRAKARRIELILGELESLPTLSAVAVRLLELTTDPDADADEIIGLVASDPSLAARVLSLCRCHERGRASDVTTVDRAVLLLGFEAVRSAVLAVQVFDILDHHVTPLGERAGTQPTFDREAFWLHSIAVAVLSQAIAERATNSGKVSPGDAFIAGLLHDIGQLVLHVLLPESFDRVCRIAETHSASLDLACQRIIGIDTHTAGRRLAEHWALPAALSDVIWLNGQPYEALPRTPQRSLIAIVTLADAVVRSHYISAGAHWTRGEEIPRLALPLGIDVDDLVSLARDLHTEVGRRAEALGLTVTHDAGILLRALARANKSLARVNAGMRQREQVARQSMRLLSEVNAFLRDIHPGMPTIDVLSAIARSLHRTFNAHVRAALFESPSDPGWQFLPFTEDGRGFGLRSIAAPPGAIPLASILRDIRTCAPLPAVAEWLLPYLDRPERGAGRSGTDRRAADAPGGVATEAPPADTVPDGTACIFSLPAPPAGVIFVIEGATDPLVQRDDNDCLLRCWASALAAGARHDETGLVTDQLAEANRALKDMNEIIARSRTMATLGEVAAGAAHEMNNPLTIISGRAQVIAARATENDSRKAAMEIAEQAGRLSDMITALRSFAEPVIANPRPTDLTDLVVRAVQQHGPGERRQPAVSTKFGEALPTAFVDPDLIGSALGELVRNACESKGARHIELRVQVDPLDDRLRIEVRDDGSGLTEHALRHAFDPFYSEKPAGRQPGLGLPRAVRAIEAHGGRITLGNAPAGGAVAAIWLDDWRLKASGPEKKTAEVEEAHAEGNAPRSG